VAAVGTHTHKQKANGKYAKVCYGNAIRRPNVKYQMKIDLKQRTEWPLTCTQIP